MRRRTIRWLVLLSALSIIGVIVTQIYWVKKTLDVRERQFNQRAHIALREVAEELAEMNGVMLSTNPVEQLSPTYFLVNTNSTTQPDVLEHFLRSSFQRHDLITDFEVGIYDCTTHQIRYGMSLSSRNSDKAPTATAGWIKTDKYPYYFGIRFPQQSKTINDDMEAWIGSSILILIALSFFAYAIFVILRQKQLSEVQRDFVNNMTHELQTPISTIRIAADVLNTPAILHQPERHKRYVQIVQEEIIRLQRQVETVLTMAKTERRKLELKIEWLDAHQVIESVARTYDGKVDLSLEAPSPYIHADAIHFGNIVNNLIDNALKYSPEKPQISVRTFGQGNQLVLAVKDCGIGIAPEYHEKIFQKFFRVPHGNIHNVKGFGIGLSYVRQIVKAHRWKLELESQVGRGSEFRIIIPKSSTS
ncbi:HAMP domain-containing sensor histidine kinase [Telluribacter sp.]|jgi:two-component system phosphate regulon sensor histidine kinase PhoR|uniref:sensor histidine kinase n=1 Tax=Telluribacter sp. TaxID=1978767 RepID=UPI002E144B85|nr:HAMP domain-containing sensor histidine kinase [Telluribacter sp.]